METKIKELIRNGDTDYATAFPSLEGSTCDVLSDIVSGGVVKRKILHIWAQEGSFEDIAFNGKVEKLKGTTYTICYWRQDKDYEQDGEDFKVQLHELAVDFICGDVVFF
ncbi:hypothetical protein SNE40_001805 [Patella caerulea]|uniref:Uncharacterized protein n=1 Tax=Patella caerulea TaxID=87958 RepID=A0AAN8QDN7_PATCE